MRALHFIVPVSLLLGGFVACGGDDTTPPPTGGTAGTGGAGGSAGSGTAGTSGAGGSSDAGGTGGGSGQASVLQHHNHATRDGVYVDPAFTHDAVTTMHIDTTFASATYTGPVTAHPLYLAGAGSVPDLVIVGTNQNHVFAFDAATGAKVWDQAVGTPLPQSNLAGLKPGGNCGNVNPLGVMGTPVIDGGSRTIYLDAMQLNGGTAEHKVYALDADTGMPRSGWPVDLNAKAKSGALNFSSLAHNQRGALALVGGRVLVPFGGHIGDCGDYHGWVVSISATDPTQISSFATRAIGGGIWAHGALASDGTSVYFATGNTMSATNTFSAPGMYGDGESVFKLPPDLTMTGATTEYFVPTNWAALDNSDADLGGTGPLPIDLPGSTPAKAILQFGKDGKAYLINRDMMGGQSAPSAVATVTSGQRAAIITAPVVYTTPTATYAVIKSNAAAGCPAGQTGTLRAVKITTGAPPTMEVAWCSGAASAGAPAVTMTSASGTDTLVWLIGDDNKLRAYDGDTGAVVFNGGADTMASGSPFRSPIFANGRAFAASSTQVYALKP